MCTIGLDGFGQGGHRYEPPTSARPTSISASLLRRYSGRTSLGAANSSRSARAVASSTSAASARRGEPGAGELGVIERGELVAEARRRRRPPAAARRGRTRARRRAPPVRAPRSRTPAARRRAPAGSGRRTPRGGGRRARRRRAGSEWRSGYATRSRLGTAMTGMRSACAITLAVVTPTRRPVNRPGPMPTAIAASWSSDDVELLGSRYSIAGASCSAWRAARRRAAPADRRAPASPIADRHLRGRGVDREQQHVSRPIAVEHAGVDERGERVARTATSDRGYERRRRGRRRRRRARAARRAGRRGSSALDAVAPLDDGDRVARRRARRSRGRAAPAGGRGGTRRRATSGSRPVVLAHDVNVGLTTGSSTPSARGDALGEHRLARAELAGEHDDVTRAQDRADPRGERARSPPTESCARRRAWS